MLQGRTPTDGKPFYCKSCGCGFAEYIACNDIVCELETEEEAKERQRVNKPE